MRQSANEEQQVDEERAKGDGDVTPFSRTYVLTIILNLKV